MYRAKRCLVEGPDGPESEERTRRWAATLQKTEGEQPIQADLQRWEEGENEAERVLGGIDEACLEEDVQAYPVEDGLVGLAGTVVDQAEGAGCNHCTWALVGFGMEERLEPHILGRHLKADPCLVEE
jgi:hypothetical protein